MLDTSFISPPPGRPALIAFIALLALPLRGHGGAPAEGVPPGTYYAVRELMAKDREAASFVEILPGGGVRIGRKLTRECWAGEEFGKMTIAGEKVRIEIDSAAGDVDSAGCASHLAPRRVRRVRTGRMVVLGEREFKLCLGPESACRGDSPRFVEYFRPPSEAAPRAFPGL